MTSIELHYILQCYFTVYFNSTSILLQQIVKQLSKCVVFPNLSGRKNGFEVLTRLHRYAPDLPIDTDFDSNVKVNYAKFKDVLA